MAVPAENSPSQTNQAGLPEVLDDHQRLRQHCAKLYGMGFQTKEIARALVDYLQPNEDKPMDQRLADARRKLRRWVTQESFRDAVYKSAVVKLDMESPKILAGIAKQAKRGRVDAARLAFEITGRHTAKGDQAPTQVAVIIGNVPRPERSAAEVVQFEDGDQDDGLED